MRLNEKRALEDFCWCAPLNIYPDWRGLGMPQYMYSELGAPIVASCSSSGMPIINHHPCNLSMHRED